MISKLKLTGRNLLFVLLLLCGVTFGQSATDRLAPIKEALQLRNFDAALQLIKSRLQELPKSPQLWTLQALAYSGQGDPKKALASFYSALKVAPDYLPALEGAAKIEYDVESKEAVSLLQHVLRLKPGDQTSHAMLGVLEYKLGNCSQAARNFEQSVPLLEVQPVAMQQYAACLMSLKEPEKAIRVFQRVLESQPDSLGAHRGLAAAQIMAGQPQDALATLQTVLAGKDPDAATVRLAVTAYEACTDTPNAVKLLREAIVRDPRNVALYVDFANIAMTHQSFQAGIDMINSGLDLQPEAPALYLARGVLYVQLADYAKAEADFEKAEQLDPYQGVSAAAHSMISEENNQQDPARALATVRSKLAKKPSDPFLWYLQANILAQKAPSSGSAEFQQAVQSARKAVTLQPSLSAAHDVLAKLYTQSGQTALSIKESRLALKFDPEDQAALYHLILVLRRTDDKREIPDLLKRLAKARQDAAREEAEHNRYKLIVEPKAQSN